MTEFFIRSMKEVVMTNANAMDKAKIRSPTAMSTKDFTPMESEMDKEFTNSRMVIVILASTRKTNEINKVNLCIRMAQNTLVSEGSLGQGQFENGKRHGTGSYVYANGDSYTGNWENDVKSGQGKLTGILILIRKLRLFFFGKQSKLVLNS